MDKYEYLILGAGPAGLSFAGRLRQKGKDSFLLLEKEAEAGGLCRSREVDGAPLDIGGGHFLDVRRPEVVNFLFGYLPEEEWDRYDRDSRIALHGKLISHPLEANIWQLDEEDQRRYLASIAEAGCNRGEPMPERFVDWIYWKLGERIAEDYMLPYNRKMFGQNLNELGTYWLNKLPNVSYEETKQSCMNHRAYGRQPGHASFYYPKKYGYGEVWSRIARSLQGHIVYESYVQEIDFDRHAVTLKDGTVYYGDKIITTIPWMGVKELTGMPVRLREAVRRLRSTPVRITYFPERLDTEAQWIYLPQPEITGHRILVRHNFCPGSRGYWTETNGSRRSETDKREWSYVNPFAYPLNTIEKPRIMQALLPWAEERKVYGLGRWGEQEHYNSDAVAERGLELAERLS